MAPFLKFYQRGQHFPKPPKIPPKRKRFDRDFRRVLGPKFSTKEEIFHQRGNSDKEEISDKEERVPKTPYGGKNGAQSN